MINGIKDMKKSGGANPGVHGPDEVIKSDLPLVKSSEHRSTANPMRFDTSPKPMKGFK